jgi:hypothetical protein
MQKSLLDSMWLGEWDLDVMQRWQLPILVHDWYMFVYRGENVVLLGELDEAREPPSGLQQVK